MNPNAVGRATIEIKSIKPRLSVRIVSAVLADPFFWLPIGLAIIFAIFQ